MALSGAAAGDPRPAPGGFSRGALRRLFPAPPSTAPFLLGDAAGVTYERLGPHLAALFRSGTPIVGICAAGILIRLLAPHLADKGTEPPVIAVSEDGLSVVPLLGGHRGANRLARTIAAALGTRAAITTAGDAALGFALDAPPPGWRVAPGAKVKAVTAALLAGEPVRLVTEAAPADWLTAGGAPFAEHGRLTVRITDRRDAPGDVVLHPAVLALGLGCERGCAPDELVQLAQRTLDDAGLAREALACVASLDLKADEPAVIAAADALGVPLRLFGAATLERETPRLSAPSDAVFRGRRLPRRGGGGGARLRRVGRCARPAQDEEPRAPPAPWPGRRRSSRRSAAGVGAGGSRSSESAPALGRGGRRARTPPSPAPPISSATASTWT